MIDEILKLTHGDSVDQCIACYKDTLYTVACCGASVCKECYLEWLKNKRQCMHCKEDQCEFDLWLNEYRIEPDFDPTEYLHELAQQEHQEPPEFEVQDLLEIIRTSLGNSLLLDPGELLPPDEAFTFEYGFMTTPTDQHGNPTGPGVTVTQSRDYSGQDPQAYTQIQEAMQNYQQLFEQLHGSPPYAEPLDLSCNTQ